MTYTAEWLLWHLMVGIALGYAARTFEHAVWATGQADQTPTKVVRFAIGFLPQAIIVGGALGLAFFATFAFFFKADANADLAGYFLPAAGAFLAGDLRNLVNRIFLKPLSH
jgi:hypothetical protein